MNTADICQNKHGGNAESQAAFESVEHSITKMQSYVFLEVSKSLSKGITSKEVAEALGKPLNAISGRLTELAREGWIDRTGERREGAAVWRATV